MGRSTPAGLSAAGLAAFLILGSAGADAADLRPGTIAAGGSGAQLALNCDNGQTYPIRVRAVSEVGELVTGYLYTSPRRAQHFRLVPMGNGYRYAGYGFWFDGVGDEATLDFHVRQTNCTVERG
jgi:hypothetical protein